MYRRDANGMGSLSIAMTTSLGKIKANYFLSL
jgi:hypothetical protein